MLHPKYIRYFKQILPFPVIWFLFGIIYLVLELGLLGDLAVYPSTQNKYSFENNLSFTLMGCLIIGFLQGWIETIWLRNLFNKKALWVKMILKTTFYLLFIFLFLILLTWVGNMRLYDGSFFDERVLNDLKRFTMSFSFWSVILYMGMALSIALFFSEIGAYVGEGILYNFFLGKYHQPKKEIRIFMFLDMKSSTTIAERLGHEKYFDLLKAYYADMTNPIIETEGEIYQYVGDEIVVSWQFKNGIKNNNCVHCFSKIVNEIAAKREFYIQRFDLIPEFKAGFHFGEVTTGEIGIIKRDIIYTGDVLNTAARIQGECNNFNTKALISQELLAQLRTDKDIRFTEIGHLNLRGKAESIQLYKMILN